MIHDDFDAYFVYGLGALTIVTAVLYGIRLATRGRAMSDRVNKIGGTAILGQGVMEWTYWAMDPITKFFVALRVTPNGMTWAALVLGLGAGVALAFGWFGLACLLSTMSTLGDILDGQIARMTNTGSDKGELLDAAVDRYTEFAFLAGLCFFVRDSAWMLGLVLAAMLASFMISYASAKAEALQVSPPRGLMRRHERSTYLITGAGFSAVFGSWFSRSHPDVPWFALELIALGIVALIGNYSAVVRFVRIGRALR
ncbi:MAG TPA: CDP-alcohol phosphatidyltransferase family protein [Kofleriaceae bacterium]